MAGKYQNSVNVCLQQILASFLTGRRKGKRKSSFFLCYHLLGSGLKLPIWVEARWCKLGAFPCFHYADVINQQQDMGG